MAAPTFSQISNMTEDQAREYIESLRWPDGPVCPHCAHNKAYKLEAKKTESKRPMRKGVYKCAKCRKQFSVMVNSIFEESKIPLKKWLMAIHLLCASKKGFSSHEFGRLLGLNYKSAWFMAHRIRYAMALPPLCEKLSGIVECDETYVGGKHKGKQGRGSENKTPVFALVERGGRVRSKVVESVTAKNLKEVIRENVETEARIMTDSFISYRGLDKEFASHETIPHWMGEYVRGDVHTNTIEGYFSILKRGIIGTYHHVGSQHLHRYCAEFDFRYNTRDVKDEVRVMAAIIGVSGKRLKFKDPIGEVAKES